MRVVPVDPVHPEPHAVAEAVACLRAGGLVAIPTETVYGLAADARNPESVARIFRTKGRPADNPLIVHVADLRTGDRLAGRITPLARRLAQRWWPGPLTLVVPARPGLAPRVTAGLDTVGLRNPSHPVAAAVLATSGLALAAPSANRSGRPSPTTAAHVVTDLAGWEDTSTLVLDAGPTGIGLESTVVDARGDVPVVLREGAVTRENLGLAPVAGSGHAGHPGHADHADHADHVGHADLAEVHRSPGTRHRHYAPTCRVELVDAGALAARAAALDRGGHRVAAVAPIGADTGPATVVARFSDAADLGRRMFAALRAAEELGAGTVLVAGVAEVGIGRAVMDRLRRAAGLMDGADGPDVLRG